MVFLRFPMLCQCRCMAPWFATLFQWWHDWFAPEVAEANKEHVYFFPLVQANGEFDFTQQFSYVNCKAACQLCVETLGLPTTAEFMANVGANTVRRGNAAKLGVAIRGATIQ